MKPAFWRLTYTHPATGAQHSADYLQRAAARGAVIVQRAQGMLAVQLVPVFA